MTLNVQVADLHVGYELPAWSRRTDLMNWNRFAAVNDEFVYFHMDDDAGRAALNEQGAFGMGSLRYAYLVNAIRDAFGDEADIREVGCSHRAINQKGDILTVTGVVTEVTDCGPVHEVRIDMNIVNQDGIGTCPGHATVTLPSPAVS